VNIVNGWLEVTARTTLAAAARYLGSSDGGHSHQRVGPCPL